MTCLASSLAYTASLFSHRGGLLFPPRPPHASNPVVHRPIAFQTTGRYELNRGGDGLVRCFFCTTPCRSIHRPGTLLRAPAVPSRPRQAGTGGWNHTQRAARQRGSGGASTSHSSPAVRALAPVLREPHSTLRDAKTLAHLGASPDACSIRMPVRDCRLHSCGVVPRGTFQEDEQEGKRDGREGKVKD